MAPELIKPPPAPLSWWQSLAAALKFTITLTAVNLLALPLYLVPVLSAIVFCGANAYLPGREYIELVALRRLDPWTARALWRSQRWRFFIAGLLITALLTVPVVNLVASLIAAAFMVHLVITLSYPAARRTL
jgi:uncharacterized protein involved in cysteine biosynthesis